MRKIIQSSAVILYNKEGRFLLQLRDASAKYYPNLWGLFGGHLKTGEKPLEALKRELQEEIGYELKNPVFYKSEKFVDNNYTRYGIRHFFIEEADETLQVIQPNEGQKMEWFKLSEIASLSTVPYFIRLFDLLSSILSKDLDPKSI